MGKEEQMDVGLTKKREKFIKDVIDYFDEYDIDEDSKHFSSELLQDYFNKYRYRDLILFNGRAKKVKKIIRRALK
ncbi:hypothetical protein CAR_c08930 [Carnobacterium sp. 17-4]|uniref:hypothetical protein n=1 Tax=Carnobacterium sp. (strain 17-4) TaxID=208596 RepID=UPI0002058CE0|nr:hypothetical protein [Carnobacterium sp. 17-4]AEB29586.1 hypothetical protein CAR_c08930 [Carnobacterium sp. 17-4]